MATNSWVKYQQPNSGAFASNDWFNKTFVEPTMVPDGYGGDPFGDTRRYYQSMFGMNQNQNAPAVNSTSSWNSNYLPAFMKGYGDAAGLSMFQQKTANPLGAPYALPTAKTNQTNGVVTPNVITPPQVAELSPAALQEAAKQRYALDARFNAGEGNPTVNNQAAMDLLTSQAANYSQGIGTMGGGNGTVNTAVDLTLPPQVAGLDTAFASDAAKRAAAAGVIGGDIKVGGDETTLPPSYSEYAKQNGVDTGDLSTMDMFNMFQGVAGLGLGIYGMNKQHGFMEDKIGIARDNLALKQNEARITNSRRGFK